MRKIYLISSLICIAFPVMGIFGFLSQALQDLSIMFGGVSWVISGVMLFKYCSKNYRWIPLIISILGMIWIIYMTIGLSREV